MKFYSQNSKVECFQGVFWACVGTRTGQAIGVWFDLSQLQVAELASALQKLKDTLVSDTQFEHKLVGTERAVATVKDFLARRKEFLKNSAVREGKFTILFDAQSARIQVSKEEALPVVVKKGKTRVLIVDDSKTIRSLLSKVLSSDADIEVVGAAEKPSEAIQMIQKLKPDVITLDIHMPEMDGVSFLKSYLPKYPIPTVMISSISMEEGPAVLTALEVGAVDYVQKPSANELSVVGPMIIEKVKMAATVKVDQREKLQTKVSSRSFGVIDQSCIVAIGSSTGGTEALRSVLTRLPAEIPPIVIVQHIPAVFSKAFADRMNHLCPFEVKEAEDGDELKPGRVIIAEGGTQMRVKKKGDGYRIVVDDSAPVNRHKPSVDVLFDSMADQVGPHSLGMILTGMGADGAKGLLKMKQRGSRTIAQDEKSCVVFGMPREAIKLGAADEIVSLQDIPERLVRLLCQKKAA